MTSHVCSHVSSNETKR